MPIRRIMPGMTVTTRIPMEQVRNRSKQNYPMPLGFMTSMEICGNGSRIIQVTTTVLMQTEWLTRKVHCRVTTGSLVEAIIPSQRKRCALLIVNPKPKPPNTLGSASRFAATPDGLLINTIWSLSKVFSLGNWRFAFNTVKKSLDAYHQKKFLLQHVGNAPLIPT